MAVDATADSILRDGAAFKNNKDGSCRETANINVGITVCCYGQIVFNIRFRRKYINIVSQAKGCMSEHDASGSAKVCKSRTRFKINLLIFLKQRMFLVSSLAQLHRGSNLLFPILISHCSVHLKTIKWGGLVGIPGGPQLVAPATTHRNGKARICVHTLFKIIYLLFSYTWYVHYLRRWTF